MTKVWDFNTRKGGIASLGDGGGVVEKNITQEGLEEAREIRDPFWI